LVRPTRRREREQAAQKARARADEIEPEPSPLFVVTEQGIAGISSGRGASIRSLDFAQCDPDEEADPVGTSLGNNGPTYDALTDTYTYVWKTDKRWKASAACSRSSWTTAASTRPSSCSSKPDPLLSEHSGPFTGAAFAFSDCRQLTRTTVPG
jgi:hypothetical protein